jgi:hypothetical protein
MWRKAYIDQEETAKAVRTRLITVLGLDPPELREDVGSVVASSASEPANAGGKTSQSPIHGALGQLSQSEDGSDRLLETAREQKGAEDAMSFQQANRTSATKCVQNDLPNGGGLHSTPDAALTELTQRSVKLVEKPAPQFKESSTRIGSNFVNQGEPTVHLTASRVENGVAEAPQVELTMDESLANLARKMTELAHGQINILEESLGKIAGEIGSRIQTEFEPVAKRMESYRAQAEEMNLMLESAFARFTQKAEQAAKGQAWLFDEKITKISEQAVARVQESIQSSITQLRETAAQSFEGRIAVLSESVERRLKENLEACSKAQLEIARQQASEFSSDLLNQVRSASEGIAESCQARLKSDAQVLETMTFEAMQRKIQKVTEEFRSVFERT